MSLARTLVTDTVATVGGLLPYDLLVRIKEGKEQTGSKPADYRLYAKGDSVRDAAERSWGYLRGVWTAYQDALARDGADADPGVHAVGLTTERWLLPLFEQLGFGALAPVPAPGLRSRDGEKDFDVSHHWAHVPVHLTGWNVPLDQRTPELAKQIPQSMVQEYLNRSADSTLWGVLSNGRQLRLLRESASLTGAAFIEFDLQAIFEGDRSDDFVLLWRLLHRTRFEPRAEGEPAATCPLEKWRTEAIDSGTRALKELRKGVEKALVAIGNGLIAHPDNTALCDALRTREKNVRDHLHPALLRLAYRLLFLFVTEDRDLLLHPEATATARETYEKYFSTARLRRLARRTGTLHGDQWHALNLVVKGLGTPGGRPELGLPALGGLFEPTETDEILEGLSLSNQALYEAVRALSVVNDVKLGRPRKVDYRHLGADELGSVYESLLELEPRVDDAGKYVLAKLDGNDRKTSGSYYTPSPLIDCLLNSTLDPLIDQAVRSGTTPKEREDALLALTVCDPACGSGHFLVAAARRIARRLAEIRKDDPEPSAEDVRHALRDVVSRCVYGVDLNRMAVELAKVSLWIEAMEPGRPLTFLDAHIKHGNGLLGTTPKLLAGGLPDDAFKPLEGDDGKHVRDLKKRNASERAAWQMALKMGARQGELFSKEGLVLDSNTEFGQKLSAITGTESLELKDVQDQAREYRALTTSRDYIRALELADAWCAAFVWKKTKTATPPALTTKSLLMLHSEDGGASLPHGTLKELARLREEYHFFHWHLEFPEVFRVPADPDARGVDERTGWQGGFSCVLGNPPWETLEFKTEEYFATSAPEIADAPSQATRQILTDKLAESEEETDRELYDKYVADKRQSDGYSHLARWSGRFPLSARGKLNTYPLFAEAASQGIAPQGRYGLVLPTGIATDGATSVFFSDVVRSSRLVSFMEFDNEAYLLSRDVHHDTRFCLMTVVGRGGKSTRAAFAFRVRRMEDLSGLLYEMPADEILAVNPNSGTLPVFRSRRDAEITLEAYRRTSILKFGEKWEGNPWGLRFRQGLFNISTASAIFKSRQQLVDEGWCERDGVFSDVEGKRYLPLRVAKMIHQFDDRFGTYAGQTEAQARMGNLPSVTDEQHEDPDYVPLPAVWAPEFDVPTGEVDNRGNPVKVAGVSALLRDKDWHREWLMGWRDVTNAANERTVILSVLPRHAVGHTLPLMFPRSASDAAVLLACLNSFPLDYFARQKISGKHLTYGYLYQLPVLAPNEVPKLGAWVSDPRGWIERRVVELAYNSRFLAPFAKDLGFQGRPFRWNRDRRAAVRAELDALFFHFYGVSRRDVSYVMDTFNIVKRAEEAAFGGVYRTKELILDIYDRMADAQAASGEYRTVLDPPPGEGPRHEA
ncbi:Eco57I restriction-modification methylase domain-containing protein [Streptomyces sp. NPDC014864]|uniref:Eco57I restriction-modification methylase domain-containing protein n=1 Tax=Streptomyces sp. NPDC014864 TaxID=3364924 RepID=UPI0036F69639